MTAKEFLNRHCQSADNVDVEASLEKFWQQMRLGLEGKQGGIPMIPTYLMDVDRSKVKVGVKNILIDAGGTNFRSAIGYFDQEGKAHLEDIRKCPMPASDRLLSKSEFYSAIASNVSHLLPLAHNVGFCFSYPVNMGADIDGTVGALTKEIQAPEIVGTKVGQETLAACKAYDNTERNIVVLNDTVATLLGGLASNDEKFSAYLGYIYGTGTNVCYIENTANIVKVKDLPAGSMLINTECGNFDGFPQGDFDRATIARTAAPSKQLFEKMASGRYLADIMYEALLVADKENLFVAKTRIRPFTLQHVSAFMTGRGYFPCSFETMDDKGFAFNVCAELILRAAKMGAIVNAALAIATCKDKSLPVAIVAEGTTFDKLPYYRTFFEGYLTEILATRGMQYRILQGEELNLVGTLMSTMVLSEE